MPLGFSKARVDCTGGCTGKCYRGALRVALNDALNGDTGQCTETHWGLLGVVLAVLLLALWLHSGLYWSHTGVH